MPATSRPASMKKPTMMKESGVGDQSIYQPADEPSSDIIHKPALATTTTGPMAAATTGMPSMGELARPVVPSEFLKS